VSPVTLGRNSDVGGLEGIAGGLACRLLAPSTLDLLKEAAAKKRAPRERG